MSNGFCFVGVWLTAIVAFTGCHDMQPSPVAPSATAPTPAPGLPPSRPVPSFSVSLNANGGVAYLGQPWSSTLSVTSSDSTAGPPASVSVQCGNEAPQFFPGFVGGRIIGCTFAERGEYPVIATVVAPNAVTTTAAVTILAVPVPIPEPSAPSSWLEIGSAARIGGTATKQEWRFSASGSADLTDFCWNFGDDSGTCGTRTEQHIYTGPLNTTKTVTVRVAARDGQGRELVNSRQLVLTFK